MTNQTKIIISLICVILIISCAGLWGHLKPQKTERILENNKNMFNLLAHWSQGNIVAITRHAERCDKSDNKCLDGQRGITVPGKEMALKLGNDFKKLLPLSKADIYNSPVKRTKQTAAFMFGSDSSDKEWLRKKRCENNLYNDIFNHKEEGKNMVLITHIPCMIKLGESVNNKLIQMDIDNKNTYGITIFIAVKKHTKQAYVLGYLYPNDWMEVFLQN